MGWLDNSTNNIILDAVLTDYGREALAKNNNSFRIAKFSLGDDEVNYGIITKYGRTIGREKIEKNTPIFEALTNGNLALKYKLISIPNPLVYLPKLELAGNVTTATIVQGGQATSIIVQQKLSSQDTSIAIDPQLAETTFEIQYPSLFLRINGQQQVAGSVFQDSFRTATTSVAASTGANAGIRESSFNISAVSITDTTFNTFGRSIDSSGKLRISTSIKVSGVMSGLSLTIPVNIDNKT